MTIQVDEAQLGTGSRGEATRARLVEAAYQQFLQRGFHGTTMRQIAEAAGLAVGGIYNHFRSKEDVFAAVLDAYHPYHVILPALEASQGDTLDDFMCDAERRIREFLVGAEEALMPLIFIELIEFQGRHMKELAERIFPSVISFIQRFTARREQLRDVPPVVIVRTFLSLLIGYLITERVMKGSPLLEQWDVDWFGGMLDIFVHGIAADEGAPPEARGLPG